MIPGAQMSHPMLELSTLDFAAALRLSHGIAGHLVERAQVIAGRPSFKKLNTQQREDFERILQATREVKERFGDVLRVDEASLPMDGTVRHALVEPALLPLQTVIGFATVLIKEMTGPLPNPDYFHFLTNLRARADMLRILWYEILGTHSDDLWAPTYDHLDIPSPD